MAQPSGKHIDRLITPKGFGRKSQTNGCSSCSGRRIWVPQLHQRRPHSSGPGHGRTRDELRVGEWVQWTNQAERGFPNRYCLRLAYSHHASAGDRGKLFYRIAQLHTKPEGVKAFLKSLDLARISLTVRQIVEWLRGDTLSKAEIISAFSLVFEHHKLVTWNIHESYYIPPAGLLTCRCIWGCRAHSRMEL